ncbi:MAG: hypothetical protein OXE96_06275 [Gemmatimonadetes bacterium]|nr:hypothetical protein [Gemmatimonadota bacterium]
MARCSTTAPSVLPVALLLAALGTSNPSALGAQLIAIRTVPVASGDQFLTIPSAIFGMGGIRIAVDDSIADGWSNPAKGVLVGQSSILGAPTFYGISNDGGGGKTFPLTGLLRGRQWFGGVSLALQQITNNPPDRWGWTPGRRLSEGSARNLYGSGYLGRELGETGWSVGVAASTARLEAMDGVDLLYAGAERIEQYGSVTDLRAGLYRTGDRDRIGFTLIHNRVSMTHEVDYVDFVEDSITDMSFTRRRLEMNEDRTRTWGGHLEWNRELQAPGWRVGATLTTNYKSHPKIPNYEIQNIPRDPGTTWAYEAGVGVSRRRGPTMFGIDVAVQPIWSHTWQEADRPLDVADGTLGIGDKTIENHFVFSNVVLRTGVSHRFDRFGMQFGVGVRSYDYRLDQDNHVEGTARRQDESWMEWTPSLALTFGLTDIEIQYNTRRTVGTGRPWTGGGFRSDLAATASEADFIAAPSGPLSLQDAAVATHQVWIRVPIR